jgi:hypothetical protein
MGGEPVTIVSSGGYPVSDSDDGRPVTQAAEGRPVTVVAEGGEPVAFVLDDLTRDPQ